MATPDIFSAVGDVDSMLQQPTEASNTQDSNNTNDMSDNEQNAESTTPIGSGNELDVDSITDDINAGQVDSLVDTGDVNAGNVAGNDVTEAIGGVEETVGGVQGGVMGQLDDVTGTGELTGAVEDLGTGDANADLPVDGSQDVSPEGGLMGPVADAEAPVGQVEDTVGDLAGGLGV